MTPLEAAIGLRRIGEYLPCPLSDIDWALSVQAMESASGNQKPIGEILIERERVTAEILADALKSQLIDRLSLSSLLENLDREKLAQIGKEADQIELEPGETLFQEGYRGNSIYVTLQGRMLLSNSEEQNEYPAGVAIPGDVLGEREFFTDGTRDCTAYATERAVLLRIGYDLIPKSESEKEQSASPPTQSSLTRRACEALRADRVHLFVRNQETGELTVQMNKGEESFEFEIMAGTNIAGWVALKQSIVNLREAYLDLRFDPFIDIQTGYWTRTLLAAPVLNEQGEVLGVLEAVNKQEGWFNSDDEVLLLAFAKQCAAAL